MTQECPPGYRFVEPVLTEEEGHELHAELVSEVEWSQHVFRMFGKEHVMPRSIAFFGPYAYGYSGTIHHPCEPIPCLARVMRLVMEGTHCEFNTILLNRYTDGSQSMGWHSDDDYEHGGKGAIASLSLGASRRFRVRQRQTRESWGLELKHCSLLLMTGPSQLVTQHSLPRTKRKVGERLNLTFRYMSEGNR